MWATLESIPGERRGGLREGLNELRFGSKPPMSTIGEIQEAIGQLPEKEKSVLAAWLQSQDEPLLSQQEEAKLLAALDQAALELDAGEGIPLERVREDIEGWAKNLKK